MKKKRLLPTTPNTYLAQFISRFLYSLSLSIIFVSIKNLSLFAPEKKQLILKVKKSIILECLYFPTCPHTEKKNHKFISHDY